MVTPFHHCTVGLAFCLAITGHLAGCTIAQADQPQLVRGSVDGRPVHGLEIIRALNRQIILGTDGWIHDFDPRTTPADLQVEDGTFAPQTAIEMRGQLTAEFGTDWDVVTTSHFLVVQPRGADQRWARLFEELHRTFTSYFRVRGVRVRSGNFPMVAVVMPDQQAMRSYLKQLGLNVSGVLGVYDRASNRIVMYDHGNRSGGIAATICHEAAHQSAFNTGVHSRFAETPHWIVEGVGCLFQSPAMIEGRRNGPRSDRIDQGLLLAYKSTYQHQQPRFARDIESLITADRMFSDRSKIEDAYTAAWALTFYLSEREPMKFAELLKLYSDLPPLQHYSAAQRVSDFQSICGADPVSMARRVARFLDQL